jgi:hypothetical protein
MKRLVCQLSGQGLTAGQHYTIRKVRITEVPGLGIASVALVQDDDSLLYRVLNAHLAFDLEQVSA